MPRLYFRQSQPAFQLQGASFWAWTVRVYALSCAFDQPWCVAARSSAADTVLLLTQKHTPRPPPPAAADGKLYEFVNGKDWRERGRGDLRLNIHRGTHRARLVMRQKGSQRLLLNANLYPKMNTSKMVGGKGATFSAVNAAPPVPGEEQPSKGDDKQEGGQAVPEAGGAASTSMKTYAFKSSADEINAFLAAVEKYKGAKVDDDAAGDTPAADTAGKPAPSNPDGW